MVQLSEPDNFKIVIANPSAKIPTKCNFFPNCTKPDCPFQHPALCTLFPHCVYGAQCRFAHPPCRYAAHCTNPHCVYSHPKIHQPVDCKNGFACPTRTSGCTFKHPMFACRFSTGCIKMPLGTCPFPHKQCKFGNACKLVSCSFGHPEDKAANPTKTFSLENVNEEVEKLSESLAFTPPRETEDEMTD